mgnify:CR=1 FL=1|tara:strand:+ start:952 stop:1191 length:240 start_codon:yes stop_codon:yes gene_type:complete
MEDLIRRGAYLIVRDSKTESDRGGKALWLIVAVHVHSVTAYHVAPDCEVSRGLHEFEIDDHDVRIATDEEVTAIDRGAK